MKKSKQHVYKSDGVYVLAEPYFPNPVAGECEFFKILAKSKTVKGLQPKQSFMQMLATRVKLAYK